MLVPGIILLVVGVGAMVLGIYLLVKSKGESNMPLLFRAAHKDAQYKVGLIILIAGILLLLGGVGLTIAHFVT